MISLASFFLVFLVAVFSYLLTGLAVKSFSYFSILDLPKERSLHTSPTPTAGGFVFILIFCILIFVYDFKDILTLNWLVFSLGLSLLGGLDDIKPQKVRTRLLGQFVLAIFCWSTLLEYLLPNSLLLIKNYSSYVFLLIFTLVSLLHINLFNFMDGSDGFAATQGIVFFGFHAIVFLFCDAEPLAIYCLTIVSILVGFLVYNWPPARIFMGDSGSYFIASQILLVGFYGYREIGYPFSIVVLTPFLSDSVLTLIKRLVGKKKWWRPHKEHVYQQLIEKGLTPAQLNIYLFSMQLLLFLPIGTTVVYFENYRNLFVLMSFGISTVIWYYLKIKIIDTNVLKNNV